jgi:hypothetical protein
MFAAVHESGYGTEGELRCSGSCGRNRRTSAVQPTKQDAKY